MSDATTAAALHLAALVASSDDAIISKDLKGIVTSWNRGAERLFGYTSAEMIGESITKVIPTDRLSEETEVLARISRGESVDHFETIRQHKDGALIPISLTVSPIRAQDGTVVGASKIARDITERRRADEALAAAKARQNYLQQRLFDLVAGSGALFESPQMQDVLPAIIALARSLIKADGYAIWRVSADGARWEVQASAGLSDGFARNVVDRYQGTAAPSTFPFNEALASVDVHGDPLLQDRKAMYQAEGIVSLLAVPLTIAGNRNGTLVLYYRSRHECDEADIQTARAIANLGAAAITTASLYDEQRSSREEATKAFSQANAASRAKDEFLATLSHELRTPLNAILGYARMLKSGVLEGARQTRGLEILERNATSLTQIVEDVLDVSRIISGKLALNVQPVDLPALLSQGLATMQPAADAKGVHVQGAIDPGATPVPGDADRLQQVIWNLISNAVKFTPRGEHITVRLERHESHVEMTVSDTGIGLSGNSSPPGQGVGLANVRDRLSALFGARARFVLEEAAGGGAKATIEVPYEPAAQLAGTTRVTA